MARYLSVPPFRRQLLISALTLGAIVIGGAAQAQGAYERAPAAVYRAAAGQALAQVIGQDRTQAVGRALSTRGRDALTLASLRETDARQGRGTVVHARLAQTVDGLEVHGAYAKAAFDGQGRLVHLIDHLVPVATASLAPARVDALQALRTVVAALHSSAAVTLRPLDTVGNVNRFDGGRYFFSAPTVEAVAVPLNDGSLVRGWRVQTWSRRDNQLHYSVVAGDGRLVAVESRTNNDSYNVFPIDPSRTSQGVVFGPGAGNAESPSGWLSGSQTTINIRGNNASTYLDTDANNQADSGGSPVSDGNFVAAADLASAPTGTVNKEVAVQNLFYLTNRMHDILYAKGFSEAAGNFQVNNFGKGGQGNDPVLAEAQDGSGTDNANFATPNDGSSPRMQMYLWTGSAPTAFVTVGASIYGMYASSFGPALTLTGINGALAVYNNGGSGTDACAAATTSLAGKIAIVDRGTCNFTDKVANAQAAGAAGVVIVNNIAGGGAFSPGGTNRKIKIPSGMVSSEDGATLKSVAGSSANLRKNPATPLQIDGDLDSDIVYHEYGHGLTWRMIGGMSGALAGAIGEGAADVNAFLVNGSPVVGTYAFSNPLGIRRYSYEDYPLTYKDATSGEVHNDGEIYAAAMWKVRANYLDAGQTVDTLQGDFVDGMNYTPSTPAFEDMRDGMLQSAAGTVRECLIWRGFAAQGIGVGAKGTVSRRGKATITESFVLPAECQ